MASRAKSSALFRRKFAFRATPTFFFHWPICAAITIFFRAAITKLFSCLGRLKPDVTLKQAIAELDTIAADLARRFPDSNTGRQVSTKPLLEFSVGEYRHLLY